MQLFGNDGLPGLLVKGFVVDRALFFFFKSVQPPPPPPPVQSCLLLGGIIQGTTSWE